MAVIKKVLLSSIFILLLSACSLTTEEKVAYLHAVNSSYNANYEDVITNIYISDGATGDNYVSVWNGKLKPLSETTIEIAPGNYGVKFTGTRYYTSGIEKSIDATTGYKSPIRFANFWKFRVTYDGEGIFSEEED